MSVRLAVLILTRNEEKNIRDCLKSVSFADEVLVVDSGSQDATCRIASSMGASVYEHDMDDTGFAGQRNYALQKTTADWVLYLDADERITPELVGEAATGSSYQALECRDGPAHASWRIPARLCSAPIPQGAGEMGGPGA